METHIPLQITKKAKWVISDTVTSSYATHLLVQQSGSDLILYFFEQQIPIIVGTPEEQRAVLEAIDVVEAKCISKIVISIENMPLVVSALLEGFNKTIDNAHFITAHMLESLTSFRKTFEEGKDHATDSK